MLLKYKIFLIIQYLGKKIRTFAFSNRTLKLRIKNYERNY